MASNRLTKTQLINVLAEKTELQKVTIKDLIALITELAEEELLAGKDFVFPGLVKLVVGTKAATKERKGINPFTKKPMVVAAKPESKKVKASPARSLKKLIK